jgi:hypothetical protein
MALAVMGAAAAASAVNMAVAAKPALKVFDIWLSCHRVVDGVRMPRPS